MSRPSDGSTDISLKTLLMAGGLCLLALWWASPRLQSEQSLKAEASQLLRSEPRPLPKFRLKGTQRPLNENALKGSWTLLYFAQVHCPDVCPTTLEALANVYRSMAAADQTRGLRIVLVSVDADDDARSFQNFVSAYEPHFEGYVGQHEEREKLSHFFNNGIDHTLDKGYDQHEHSGHLFLIDPEAHHVATWNRLPDRTTLQQDICSFINCPS